MIEVADSWVWPAAGCVCTLTTPGTPSTACRPTGTCLRTTSTPATWTPQYTALVCCGLSGGLRASGACPRVSVPFQVYGVRHLELLRRRTHGRGAASYAPHRLAHQPRPTRRLLDQEQVNGTTCNAVDRSMG